MFAHMHHRELAPVGYTMNRPPDSLHAEPQLRVGKARIIHPIPFQRPVLLGPESRVSVLYFGVQSGKEGVFVYKL